MLADLAQASGSDCTRHRTERGARQNQTMSKIGGGLFKYAPDEYSPRANRLPDADSRRRATGSSQTAERLRTIVQQVFHQRLVSVHQWFGGFISG